jgi:putative DNA primase/helicase
MTNSIWRRIKIVPFEEVLPESEWDRKLAEKLKATELPGIFNWAIKGLMEYYEKGLCPPKIVTKATSDYKMEQDILHDFIFEVCDIPKIDEPFGKSYVVKSGDLYNAYKTWNTFNGDEKPMSSTKFGRLLRDKGFAKDRDMHGVSYLGIKIKSDRIKR